MDSFAPGSHISCKDRAASRPGNPRGAGSVWLSPSVSPLGAQRCTGVILGSASNLHKGPGPCAPTPLHAGALPPSLLHGWVICPRCPPSCLGKGGLEEGGPGLEVSLGLLILAFPASLDKRKAGALARRLVQCTSLITEQVSSSTNWSPGGWNLLLCS